MTRITSALLVVDVQQGLFTEPRPVYDGACLLQNINRVISQMRQANCPIIAIQDDDVGPIDSDAWQLHPALAVHAADYRARKAYGDAFYQTTLHTHLQHSGITQLVVVGCKTDMCIDITCRRAVSLGYDIILVSDGHSTTDDSLLSAAQIIAYHNAMLDGFGGEDGFGNGQHAISIQRSTALAL